MKKLGALSILLVFLLPLSGCAAVPPQLEHQSYAISMSLDKVTDGRLSIAVQIPRLSGTGDTSGQSNYAIFSAVAATYPEALQLLKVTVPSNLRLSHLKSIVVSEELARSEEFPLLIDSMIQTYHLYGSAKLIVSTGNAQKFIEAQQPTAGSRLSSSVVAMLQHFEQDGYTPSTTLYGLYGAIHSVYSDPVTTLAATWEKSNGEPSGGETQSGLGASTDGSSGSGGSGGAGGGSSSGAESSSGSGDSGYFSMHDIHSGQPGKLSRTGPDKNEYAGCALIKDGRMVGMLSGEESRWLAVLNGTLRRLGYVCADQLVTLSVTDGPSFEIQCAADKLSISLNIGFEASPLIDLPDLGTLRSQIEQDMRAMIEVCIAAGVEPMNLSEKAAGQFSTLQAFEDYGFREKFLVTDMSLSVSVSPVMED